MPSPLANPTIIRGAYKSARANLKTGSRRVSLSFPAIEADAVARLSVLDGIVFEIVFTPEDEDARTRIPTIIITGEIAGTSSNAETGERVVTLDFKKSEALKVAQLTRYDMVVFDVRFTPADVAEDEDRL